MWRTVTTRYQNDANSSVSGRKKDEIGKQSNLAHEGD
jgi:hypothetical protein